MIARDCARTLNRNGLNKDKTDAGSGRIWHSVTTKNKPTVKMNILGGCHIRLSLFCHKRIKNAKTIHAV